MKKEHRLLIINKNLKIIEAIKKLDNQTIKNLCVVDNTYKLLGTITDGDIRRGLLKGFNTNSSVSCVMYKTPKKILNKNKNKTIQLKNLILPIVDKKNIIKDLKLPSENNLSELIENRVDVVIMAGGFGKRLLPITKKIPPIVNFSFIP